MHSKNKEQSMCTHFPGISNIFSERPLLHVQYPSIIVSMVKFSCVNITVKRDKVKLVDYKSIYNDNPACSVLQPDWLIQSRGLSVYFKLLGNGGDDLDRYNVRESKREGESSTCTLLPLTLLHRPLLHCSVDEQLRISLTMLLLSLITAG